ncbi:DUF397 domain-containing protein [Streptomyces sp. NPDC046939]|uniref:DUF397 domain-containing protein n=1 Tax=Streptomyces sp. NPDC046939 TaxID=3155376 RepID=UPI003401DAEA
MSEGLMIGELTWQKSAYSQEASSCVYIATAPDGTLRLRESDVPNVVLATSHGPLHALIRALKAGPAEDVQV